MNKEKLNLSISVLYQELNKKANLLMRKKKDR